MNERPGGNLFSSIIKIASIIVGFVGFLASIYQFSPYWKGSEKFDKYFIVVVVLLLIILFIIKQYIDKKNSDKKLYIEHIKTHEYAHYLRDTTYEADKLSEGEVNDKAMRHLLKSFSEDTIKCIHQILCILTGIDVYSSDLMVSIKILDFQFWNNESIIEKDKTKCRTLSRSLIPQGSLQADDGKSHEIGECTALTRIFIERMHDWTGLNLNNKKSNVEIITKQSKKKGINFTDSCENFIHYYNNKIVVPIRVELKKIDDRYEGKDDRNLFGFICVEYKNRHHINAKNEFDENLISYCDLLKTFADTMYFVFDRIYSHMSYSQSIQKKEQAST